MIRPIPLSEMRIVLKRLEGNVWRLEVVQVMDPSVSRDEFEQAYRYEKELADRCPNMGVELVREAGSWVVKTWVEADFYFLSMMLASYFAAQLGGEVEFVIGGGIEAG